MRRVDKLSKKELDDLVLDLVNSFVACGTLTETASFLQDLLTMNEMKTLAKRLRIAKLLLAGMTYEEIAPIMHSGHGTIAKIAAWLAEKGDGFRNILKKLPVQKQVKQWNEYSEWDKVKRQYSLYFWPELLLEEIIKNANISQKKRIQNVLLQLKEKSELHRRIEKSS